MAFALRAVGAIKGVCGASSGDLHRMSYWWGNVQQLRWMLWACCQSEATLTAAVAEVATGQQGTTAAAALPPPPPSPLARMSGAPGATVLGWIMHSLVPPLRELECWLFEQMAHQLWWWVLLPAAAEAAAAAADRGPSRNVSREGSNSGEAGPSPHAPEEASSLQGTPRQFESAEVRGPGGLLLCAGCCRCDQGAAAGVSCAGCAWSALCLPEMWKGSQIYRLWHDCSGLSELTPSLPCAGCRRRLPRRGWPA